MKLQALLAGITLLPCVLCAEQESVVSHYVNQARQEEAAADMDALVVGAAINTPRETPLEIIDPATIPNKKINPLTGDPKTDAAYQKLLEGALPLSPDQMMYLRKLQDISQQAVATPPNAPPTPLSSTQVISLEPGATPPVIRLAAGFVSSLVFVDVTGAPWPLTAYGLGDPSSFNIQWDQNSNAIFIQASKAYAHGNLAIRLKDLNTPVILTLISGQKQIDYRVDLQLTQRGPLASAPIMNNTKPEASVNSTLINMLDGIPPEGSLRLEVPPIYGQAWLHNKRIYFRTQLQVLSPAWLGTVSAPDGTRVYEMMQTPVILASENGKTISISVRGL